MKSYQYPRIPDEEYYKIIGQFKHGVGQVLTIFDRYGMGDYIPGACDAIVTLAEQLSMRVRGKTQPIALPPHIRQRFQDRDNPDD